MANCRTPGPLGTTAYADFSGDSTSCQGGHLPGPAGIHYHRPIQVADADKDKSKDKSKKPPAKTPDKPKTDQVKIDSIILHMYLPVGVTKLGDHLNMVSFSPQDFLDWLRGKRDDSTAGDGKIREWQPDRWEDFGISVELKTNIKTAVDDFKKSLQSKGAIVVYFGHSALDQYHNYASLGLTPHGNEKPEIPNKDLQDLLTKSKAPLVIIASCDSLTAVGKPNGSSAVIATDSGADHVTDSRDWANALGIFFFSLIGLEIASSGQPTINREGGHATLKEAVDASGKAFEDSKQPDRFKLVHGDGSLKLIP